jgi:hypothetical protein
LSSNYRQTRNGVRFAPLFLLGRGRDSLLHIRSTRKLTLNEAPIVTVTGKAFWDIGHASKDQFEPQKESSGIRGLGDSPGAVVAGH